MAEAIGVAAEKKPKRQNGEGSVFYWPGRGWYAAVTGTDGRRVMRKAPRQTERGAERLLRYEGALERQLYRAIRELRELQKARLGGAALGPVTIELGKVELRTGSAE